MAISPIGSGTSAGSRQKLTADSPSQAQRDAQARIAETHRQVQEAERDMSRGLEQLREQHEKQSVIESDRQEQALENQRAKGYEAIRDAQRSQQAELARIRREGEKQVSDLKTYYRDAIYGTEKRGRDDLRELQNRQTAETAYQMKNFQAERADTETAQAKQNERFRAEKDAKLEQAAEVYRKEYERIKNSSNFQNEQAETRFLEQHDQVLKRNSEILDRLNSRATAQVAEIREDTSHKLSAYAERQSDPFYRLVDIDAEIFDAGDAYILTASIPDHEDRHLTATMKGNHLVISGYRRNEEKLDLQSGVTKSTSAYQSFNESFPLPLPVDAKQLTREIRDGELIVTVPKLNPNLVREPASPKAPRPEKARVERPKFPENLVVAQEEKIIQPDEGKNISIGTKGSRPLA
ncbi:MAG TPA: Hsp20 family protein [Bdellovibrionota bacterium]|nr:Hsp20 family protein [Bdellovibrionota bacterium]